MELDEETRKLAEEVGTAINESVRQSAGVADAIERLREAGFEMELSLKLEIGVRPRQLDKNEDKAQFDLNLTEEDLCVLRSMKIKLAPDRFE